MGVNDTGINFSKFICNWKATVGDLSGPECVGYLEINCPSQKEKKNSFL